MQVSNVEAQPKAHTVEEEDIKPINTKLSRDDELCLILFLNTIFQQLQTTYPHFLDLKCLSKEESCITFH